MARPPGLGFAAALAQGSLGGQVPGPADAARQAFLEAQEAATEAARAGGLERVIPEEPVLGRELPARSQQRQVLAGAAPKRPLDETSRPPAFRIEGS